MKASVKTFGFIEMDRALGEFSKPTAKNVLRRTAVEALEPMADIMRAKAPRDDGDLIDAIGVGTKLGKRQKRMNRNPSTVEAYAGVKVVGAGMPPQATQQEFGNEHHGPQPFVRPAWEQDKAALLDRTRDSLARQIDAARGRAQRKALKAKR